MKDGLYSSTTAIKKGYSHQLIYYYNTGIGKVSEIAGETITKTLISAIERRYKQLGGILPIKQKDIDDKKGKGWKQI